MKQKEQSAPKKSLVRTGKAKAAAPKSGRNSFQWLPYLPIPVACLCIVLTVALVSDMILIGTKAAGEAFDQAENKTEQTIYQQFYDKAFDDAEKAHHVSNHASISIDGLREMQKLEVLPVSEVSYQVEQQEEKEGIQEAISGITGLFNKDNDSWLEVPGKGVFTVDLQASEFIVDAQRQLVLIRVPEPELFNFTLDYENVEVLYFDEGGVLKNSAKYGVDRAVEQLQNAELEMIQRISNNQELYQRARTAAENMLTRLVKELNPQLPDLTVEVEFLD